MKAVNAKSETMKFFRALGSSLATFQWRAFIGKFVRTVVDMLRFQALYLMFLIVFLENSSNWNPLSLPFEATWKPRIWWGGHFDQVDLKLRSSTMIDLQVAPASLEVFELRALTSRLSCRGHNLWLTSSYSLLQVHKLIFGLIFFAHFDD